MAVSTDEHVYILSSKLHSAAEFCMENLVVFPLFWHFCWAHGPNAGFCLLWLHFPPRFDVETRHAFVGDQSGQVTILKLEQDSCSLVTTFKGHTGTKRILIGILKSLFQFYSTEATEHLTKHSYWFLHNGCLKCQHAAPPIRPDRSCLPALHRIFEANENIDLFLSSVLKRTEIILYGFVAGWMFVVISLCGWIFGQ